MTEEPLISVAIITYNQEKFISQTLESILSQKHSCTYEIIIGDDCSTDRNREIIESYREKYPEIIKPIYNQNNLGLIKNYFNVMAQCRGKYIMQCAGDDWWLPEKLSIQVDFMETHPDIGMCYGKAQTYIDGKKKYGKKFGEKRESFESLLGGNTIPAVTACFRRDLLERYLEDINPLGKNWLMEDYPLWLWFSHESRICFIDKIQAIYRVLSESASHSMDIEKALMITESYTDIKNFFYRKYVNSNEDFVLFNKDIVIAETLMMNSKISRDEVEKALKKVKDVNHKLKLKYLISKSGILLRLVRNLRY